MVILLGFDVTSGTMVKYLDLVEGDNIDGLDEVLEFGNFFFEKIGGNEIVDDNTGDLEKKLSRNEKMSLITWSFLIPYPMATSLPVPHKSPSISIVRTLASSSAMSVSSSQGLTSKMMLDLATILPFFSSLAAFRAL